MANVFHVGGAQVTVAGKTDTGRRRSHNEDCLYLAADECLLVVADGMGGHDAGDVASRIAVDAVTRYFGATREEVPETWPFRMEQGSMTEADRVTTAILLANQDIYEHALKENHEGNMGTTMVAAWFCSKRVTMGHVGDSRIYRVRDGHIRQLTEDHSLLNDYIKLNRISADDVANFPHQNVIVRALGMKEQLAVDVLRDEFCSGDKYLLCSDGLSGMVNNETIQKIVNESENIEAACASLIATANDNGGKDNITVAMAHVSS